MARQLARRAARIDPVTVEIVRNKVASLVDEMHYHFYRSGYSTIIRESRDFSCVILDRAGRLITPPPMFFHAPVYRHFTARVLELYGAGAIAAGDVFVSNHPYEAGMPHVSDMGFFAPIFAKGTLIGFSGSIAHKADIGGTNPGSTSANATEMFHEGLLVPPVKIAHKGRYDEDLERLILANSRQPDLVRGDVRAQIAATEMGARRMAELGARFGAETVMGAFAAILDGTARALAAAIRALPEGTESAEGFMDDDGVELDKPVKFAVTITVSRGRIAFDFSASGPQAKGPVNLRPSMVEACVFYSLIGALDPELKFNDGMRDVVTLALCAAHRDQRSTARAGVELPESQPQARRRDPRGAGPLRARRARSRDRARRARSSSTGQEGRPGHANLQYEIFASAYGGGNGHDGASMVATHLSNLHITPIEILESEFPCRITEFSIIPDSGGAGRYRGGTAFRRRYRLLQDATVVRRYDRARFPASGAAGGADGRPSRFVLVAADGSERAAPSSGRFELKAGEGFYLDKAGGGGWGDPHQRDPDSLKRDIEEGSVSPDAARRDYGSRDKAGNG